MSLPQQEGEPGIIATRAFINEQLEILRLRAEQNFPGATYAFVYNPEQRALVPAPTYTIISSPFSHPTNYGSGVFEGSSAMVHEGTGIPHVILLEPRNDRLFNRSLPARGYSAPVSRHDFAQATLDIVAINGLKLFENPDKTSPQKHVRAYIRPSVHPASLGGMGVSLRKDHPIEATIIAWTWPDYLDPRVYTQGGVAAITGHQRLFPITGKHASNYGASAMEAGFARSLGANELIYLAPYLTFKLLGITCRFWSDPDNRMKKFKYGALADGPGEEVFAVTKDGKTIVYPPVRVNRLGGTVLAYVVRYMAPALGFKTQERDITLRDLRKGRFIAVGMIGNAVKIAPLRELQLYDGDKMVDIIELFQAGNVPEPMIQLIHRWDAETRGLIDPSHPSLITPVNMKRGEIMREMLDQKFAAKTTLP